MELFNRRSLFNRRQCEVCEVYRNTIQILKDNEAFLQSQIVVLEEALLKATRLAPVAQTENHHHQGTEPISTMPMAWNTLKTKLEAKHKKKPEDRVEETWKNKISDLEAQAGLSDANADILL